MSCPACGATMTKSEEDQLVAWIAALRIKVERMTADAERVLKLLEELKAEAIHSEKPASS